MLRIRATTIGRRYRNKLREEWVVRSTWAEVYCTLTWRRLREHNWGPLVECLTIMILLLAVLYAVAALVQSSRSQAEVQRLHEASLKKAAVAEKAVIRCLNGGAVAYTETEIYWCSTKIIPFKRI